MRPPARFFVKNTILAGISLQDLAAMGGLLEPVVLKERLVLQEPKKKFDHVYFVESGLVSLRIVAAGSILETAVIGFGGPSELRSCWERIYRPLGLSCSCPEAHTGFASKICVG
jgi:hypothetical protein